MRSADIIKIVDVLVQSCDEDDADKCEHCPLSKYCLACFTGEEED